MTWIHALEVVAAFLIAGLLLYVLGAWQIRARAREAGELADIRARLHELLRRRDFIRSRFQGVQALFGQYRQQRRSLSEQVETLWPEKLAFERGDASFSELLKTTLRLRNVGLEHARHHLPYLLSLIAYESDNLEAEAHFVWNEGAELDRRLWRTSRLAGELGTDARGELQQLGESKKDLAMLREAVRDELALLTREQEHWNALQERWLELEMRLALEQKSGAAALAAPAEQERGLAVSPPELAAAARAQLRELEDAANHIRDLVRSWEHENLPALEESLTQRWNHEIMPRLADSMMQRWDHEIMPRLTDHLERRLAEELARERQRTEERLPAREAPRPPRQRTERLPALEVPRPPVFLQSLWPRRVRRAEWHSLLVYLAAGPAGLAAAEADAQRRLRAAETYAVSGSAALRPISRGALVTVVPELPGFRFNPPSATLLWLEDWQCAEIRMQALPEAEVGRTVRGRVSFFIGPLLIGENDLEVEILEPDAGADLPPREPASRAPLPGRSLAPAYRSIFVSYAHADAEIVDRLQAAYRALGDSYFRDVEILRSGEKWSPALLEKIREADVFQLCWSEAARASAFVEQEWRHALHLERECFVRPMYWREPLPARPAELADIHFAYVEMAPAEYIAERYGS